MLNGYGQAGALVALGDYEILSADDAAARLNGSAFQPTMVSWGETGVVSDEVWEPATTPPAVPAAGSAVPWAIAEYEIVSARLGLATVYAPDDTRYLAPAYEFTDSAGNVWSVIAIAEGALVTSP